MNPGLLSLLKAEGISRWRRLGLGLISIAAASLIWVPLVHLCFTPSSGELETAEVSDRARGLAERHLALWESNEARTFELTRMRASNPEWDFMGRTYLVLALINMALRDAESSTRYLDVVDRIIADTLRLEKDHGPMHFLMPYAHHGNWLDNPPRSVFVDGEIAVMLAARRMAEEHLPYKQMLKQRVAQMLSYMTRSPVLCGESYPNECWMFCNTVALVALKMHEVLDGTNHSGFIREWLSKAKEQLTHVASGLLISSFSRSGSAMDGPEGSSIWMVVHCLRVVDESFAREQYEKARTELRRGLLGFGWAAEWPASWNGPMDVDSGPVIPVLEVSAGSSGMAFLAAASFGDREFLGELLTTLDFAAFPTDADPGLKYSASNQVGDAVLLYALVMGPLWDEIKKRGEDGR